MQGIQKAEPKLANRRMWTESCTDTIRAAWSNRKIVSLHKSTGQDLGRQEWLMRWVYAAVLYNSILCEHEMGKL